MSGKLVILGLLTACATGAYVRFGAISSRLGHLMQAPEAVPRLGGAQGLRPQHRLEAYCLPGRATVFLFVRENDPACQTVLNTVRDLCRLRPDVAVRLILFDGGWDVRRYLARNSISLRSVPHVLIYDWDGKLVAADRGQVKNGTTLLLAWAAAERRRAAEQRAAAEWRIDP